MRTVNEEDIITLQTLKGIRIIWRVITNATLRRSGNPLPPRKIAG
jgi:hypothetical protein